MARGPRGAVCDLAQKAAEAKEERRAQKEAARKAAELDEATRKAVEASGPRAAAEAARQKANDEQQTRLAMLLAASPWQEEVQRLKEAEEAIRRAAEKVDGPDGRFMVDGVAVDYSAFIQGLWRQWHVQQS